MKRNIIITLCILLVLVLCSYFYYNRERSFPYDTQLTNKEGRKIEVTLTGKSETFVRLKKNGEEKAYDVPLSRLHENEQSFLGLFPVTIIPKKPIAPPPAPKKQDLWITEKQKEITKLLEKRSDLTMEYKIESENKVKRSAIANEVKRIDRQVKKLELDIQRLRRSSQL
jgi:hypothetical protein